SLMSTSSIRHSGQLHIGVLLLTCAFVAAFFSGAVSAEKASDTAPPRLDLRTAEQLHEQLRGIPEIGIGTHKELLTDLKKELAGKAPAKEQSGARTVLDLQKRAWKTLGLTCRPESDQLLFRHEAEHLQTTARLFRMHRVVSLPDRDALSKPQVTTFDQL